MELIFILIIPIAAALLSLVPAGKKFASGITIAGAVAVFILTLRAVFAVAGGRELTAVRNWISSDGLGVLILLLVAFVGLTSAIFSRGYMGRIVEAGKLRKVRRYYFRYNLFVFSMLSIPILSQVSLVWVLVELTTLLSVLLVSFENTAEALEAAWKYIVLTGMGAAFALLGILILYWGMHIAGGEAFTWAGLIKAAPAIPPALLKTAFIFILIGFGTKIGLVPLHTWLPDAHSQAPAPVCALLSGVETTTVLYVVLRLLPVLEASKTINTGNWFIVSGLISVGAAAFLLIQVKDYKRLFAFSTIEHMGIIMVAAGLGGFAGHLGAVYQILTHSITKSLSFFAAGSVFLLLGSRNISSVKGLIKTSPITGAALLIGGLAIAGAPPFAVFLSEFSILKAGIAGGNYLTIGLLTVFIVIAFCALMFHVNRMVFGKPAQEPLNPGLPPAAIVALVLAVIPVILLGFYIPGPLNKLLLYAASSLGR